MTDLEFMLDTVRSIYDSDRWYSYDSMWETSRRVEAVMRSLGMTEVQTLAFDSDGVVDHGGWIMPIGWNPRSGILERVLSDGGTELICSYQDMPCCLMLYSRGADVTAEVTMADAADISGKFVLATDHGIVMPEAEGYFARGAVGVLCSHLAGAHWGKPGQEHLEDSCQWCNYTMPYRPVDGNPFGFSLTPNQGRALKARLDAGETVTLHAAVDAEVKAGKIPLVTGLLPGETDEEILITGHLFEQGANDNASGVAEGLAVVRALAGQTHKRGIRLMFTHEIKSLQAYLNETAVLPKFKAGLDLDMVAVSTDRETSIGPSSAPYPTYAVPLLMHFIEKHGCKIRNVNATGGMDTMLCDPFLKVPMVFTEYMDDPNYHKSSDTVERLVTEHYQRTFDIALEFTALLVDATAEDGKLMADSIMEYEARQPHPKGEKAAFARRVLQERLDSVLAYAENAAERKMLEDYLAPLKAEAGRIYPDNAADGSDAEPARAIAGTLAAVMPRKNFQGLFAFEKYWHRKGEFPKIAPVIGGWHACAWIELAFMWADGTRSALDIWHLLRDYGLVVEPQLFADLMDFLLQENYLTACGK